MDRAFEGFVTDVDYGFLRLLQFYFERVILSKVGARVVVFVVPPLSSLQNSVCTMPGLSHFLHFSAAWRVKARWGSLVKRESSIGYHVRNGLLSRGCGVLPCRRNPWQPPTGQCRQKIRSREGLLLGTSLASLVVESRNRRIRTLTNPACNFIGTVER